MAPDDDRSSWSAMGELLSVGITLVLSTVIGLAAGYYADRWLGTSPWLLLIGLLFGIVAGFVSLFRAVNRANKDMK
jgi:ATP synthase protein I